MTEIVRGRYLDSDGSCWWQVDDSDGMEELCGLSVGDFSGIAIVSDEEDE